MLKGVFKMSADNGIYILKTKRTALEKPKGCWTNGKLNYVYRVAYACAIDNLGYYKEKQPYNLGAYMRDVWGESEVFTTEEAAMQYANDLDNSFDSILEYGICKIDMSEYVFYGDI